jgi:hypothetical protein
MAYYVDLAREPGPPPTHLTLNIDDVLRFNGSGAIVREGSSIEIVGIFCEAILATNGEVLAPQGSPNVILVRARTPGSASLEIVTADPSRPSSTARTVRVVVTETKR